MAAASSAPTQSIAITCPARTRRGTRCGMRAGFGTDHVGYGLCKHHGGSTPNGKKNAAKLELEALTEARSLTIGQPISPHDALQDALDIANAEFAFWAGRVAALSDDALVVDGDASYQIRMMRDANERRAHLGKLAHDAGVEERRVRLAEQLVGDLADAIDLVLTRLGVRDHPDAPQAVRAALQLVEAPRAITERSAA